MNISAQNSIDEFGNIVPKDRLTHDQSFKWSSSGTSVNSRVLDEHLSPLCYGHALRRFINSTVALRNLYPENRIYCSKVDFNSAFRRMHLNHETAVKCCTILPEEKLALMYLRLTFGGKPCPSEWSDLSEMVCDLANAIANDKSWDHNEVYSPISLLIPEPKSLPDDIELSKGKKLVVDLVPNECGNADIFIDDIFGLTVADLPEDPNVDRLGKFILLSIDAIARRLRKTESIPRSEMAAMNKLIAESLEEELKIVLGWFFNFRRLTMALPINKHAAWTGTFHQMIKTKKTNAKELRQQLGRMVHVSQVLPEINHFLNRLRCLLRRAENRRSIAINDDCLADCRLLIKFIDMAEKGISLNNLANFMPGRVYMSDSCPHGLGGYSDKGKAWRLYLPPELLF